MRLNENLLAKTASESEGGARNLPIAEIKEVQRITYELLAYQWASGNEAGVIELLKRHHPARSPTLKLADDYDATINEVEPE